MKGLRLFVTGTDTGVGKTLIATALLEAARGAGRRTLGVKPVAAGCERVAGRLVNADAEQLRRAASVSLDYEQVNPVALEPAIAPHIAAARAGVDLKARDLIEHCRGLEPADLTVIEGAGGWLVPLNASETLADVCVGLDAAVVLVVGVKLGCINHAQLTAASVRSSGARLVGWVGSCVEPELPALDENLAALRQRLDAACLGIVPFLDPCTPRAAAAHLELSQLSGWSR